jgi:formate dehydrogenase iron-sulfur subunit
MISRRDLLRAAGPASLGLVGVRAARAQARTRTAILFDSSLCLGCQACRVACQAQNGTGPAATFLRLPTTERGAYPRVAALTRRTACYHCGEAACVAICPVKATYKGPTGLTHVNVEQCIECGLCTKACPFGVPVLRANYPRAGMRRAFRCVGCESLVNAGQTPACVSTCIGGALRYGPRDQMVREAQARVAALRGSHPAASVYDAPELGGLNVLMILREAPAAYRLPARPQPAKA